MLTQQELLALTELLNRLPMTQAEMLFVQHILNKLQAEILEQSSTPPQ